MSSSAKTKRIWRGIGKALAAIILIPAILLAGYIMYLSAGAGANALHPPQIPITQLPAELGIADVQTISLTTQDQVQLKAWYIPPQPETGMVILLLHGYAHNRQDVLPEAKILTGHGFGALLLDLRGHGESQSAAVTFGEKEQLDVRAALDWLSARPEVKRIGGMGFSMGGATMALASARDARISRSVVAVAYPTLQEELWFRARIFGWLSQVPSYLSARRAGLNPDLVRPRDELCAISPRPLLLIYGGLDEDVPPGSAEEMRAAACSGSELWFIPNAGHGNFSQVIPKDYESRLVAWFKK